MFVLILLLRALRPTLQLIKLYYIIMSDSVENVGEFVGICRNIFKKLTIPFILVNSDFGKCYFSFGKLIGKFVLW